MINRNPLSVRGRAKRRRQIRRRRQLIEFAHFLAILSVLAAAARFLYLQGVES